MADPEWQDAVTKQRRAVRWSHLNNEDLKRALDRHSHWEDEHEVAIANEIERRRKKGEWLDENAPPLPTITLTPLSKILVKLGIWTPPTGFIG